MGDFMARLARFAIRFRFIIIASWLILAAACITLMPSLSSAVNTSNSSFLPASTPSQKAMHLAAPFSPPNTTTATLVVVGKSKLTTSDQNAITSLENKIAKDQYVRSVTAQGQSKDDRAEMGLVVINLLTSSTQAAPAIAAIRSTIAHNLPSGLTGYLTGQLASSVDNQNSQDTAQKRTQNLALVVIAVMLFIVYRGLLAPLITLGVAELVLQTSARIIAELSTSGLQVSTITQTMLIVLVLGAGTDYGLFLLLRIREEMARGARPHAAIERAGRYIGESITFSGGTVIGALLCLLLATFGLYSGLGPALALGIALMLLASLTLTPALAAVFGQATFWPRQVRLAPREGLWAQIADVVIRHPVITVAIGVIFFGTLAGFATGYASSGFGGTTTGPAGSQSAKGTAAINSHYPAAVANPTTVLYVFKSSVWKNLAPAQTAENDLSKKSQFASVSGLFDPNGSPVTPSQLTSLYQELGPPGMLPATPPADVPVTPQQYASYRASAQFVSPDGKTVQFYTSLTAGSPASKAAMDSVPTIRSQATEVQHSSGAVNNGVTGLAPSSYDVSTVSRANLHEIVPIVIVLLMILLGLLLRSVVAPLYLVATVLLSYFAALGIAVLIFQVGASDSGLNFVLPFLLFIFLMALGEDYNILVMSRIREEATAKPLREAVADGAHHTGATVTSAGMILAATFGTAAVTGATSQITQLSTAIAIGILLDTFLVRTLLVPAIVILCGRWNWWPSRLSRHGPDQPAAISRGAKRAAAPS